ncbi:ribonuclease III family protein [Mesoterricola sediminis]|uniref:Ribonuclease 3 n=1 Tax=Mesoterricola sediminis TaxID=2927980 RepID=A0AA48KHY2_9BACT|nr:ribonuclease III domain-containing protein [Mesoterricola sediminis]BDU78818.1 ribonuclease 3 [Mesoterricola sediminis]
MSARKPTPLEAKLGYTFRDPALVEAALTPPSAGLDVDNQRLEFLGDAVLQLCVSRLVYREHPAWPEGALTKLRGLVVCADALHAWAEDLGLEVRMGPRSGRRTRGTRNELADAVEALLAAVHLDLEARGRSPLDGVMALVEARFLETIRRAYLGVWEVRDTKTTLQERAAVLSLGAPVYEEVSRQGPDHAPTFTVKVRVGPHEAVASAGSLKRAQMEAARLLLEALPASSAGAPS